MIIGNGDIASVLQEAHITHNKDFVFFASGVSNSKETKQSEFDREKDLLLEQDRRKHLVYFSSISSFWNDTPYFKHKRWMEKIIRENWKAYTIVRVGNITWGNNPHTLINFFKRKIKNNESIEIKNEYRYILDKEEFLYWIDLIPEWSCEITIPGKRMKIIDVAKEYGYA